jgi:2-polyprenyl-6-methoxyphenol hydroxylase-like FAD-dependent oxidoreductase
MEHLRRWGVADRLRAAAPLAPRFSQDAVFCTSLSGRELSRFTGVFGLDADPDRCPEVGQQAPQYVLEEVLREVAGDLPACTLALGARVAGLQQTDTGVRVVVETRAGHGQVEAEYVIGADGSRSVVREAIGASYVGNVALRPNLGATFRAPDLWRHVPHGRAVHYWILNERAPAVLGPLDTESLWFGTFLDVDRQRGEREIVAMITAAIGREVPLEVLSTDPWTAHMEIVDTCRNARVFLAGDAAHLNPPWGGHGMNTGFGDAVDLGWKLAAVLDRWGGQALLESYELERRPVQTQIIDEATANMNVLSKELLSDRIDQDGPAADEARARLHERIQETKAREFHSLDLVLGLGYEHSPIIPAGAAGPLDTRRWARPGFRLPHAWLAPGQAVFDVLGPGFTLLYTHGNETAACAFATACADRRVPSNVVNITSIESGPAYEPGLVIVRPDQHVAWAGEQLPDPLEQLVDIIRGAVPADLSPSRSQSPPSPTVSI